MNELSLRYNRGKIARFTLICAAAAIGGVGGLYSNTSLYVYTLSWLGVLLFGVFAFPALLYLSFNKKTQVSISPEQIVFHMKVHVNRKAIANYAVSWDEIVKIQFSGSILLLTLHEQKMIAANGSLLDVDWVKFQQWLPEMQRSSPEQRAKLIADFQAA